MITNRKTKGKKQKRGFPISDFGNETKRSPRVVLLPLSVIPEWFYQDPNCLRAKKHGFPPLVTPAIFKPL